MVFWTLAQGFISSDTVISVRWKLSVPDSQLSVSDLKEKRKTGFICHCTADQQQSLFLPYSLLMAKTEVMYSGYLRVHFLL